jgi:glycosyltransferase involved in cell wall biosynthesis
MHQVLQVIGDGRPGGGTTAVLGLAQGLAQKGIPVTIASDRNSYVIRQARASGIPVFELDFSRRFKTPRITMALAQYLRTSPPTIVHAHGARAGLPVAMLTASLRIGMAYTVHGFHFRHKPPVTRYLAKTTERFCIRRSSITVFVSYNDAQIACLEALITPNDRHQIIRNGSPAAEPTSALATPDFDIAYIGRIVPHKNPLMLLKVLLALRPARPTLCVIGGGDDEYELRRCVRDFGLDGQVTFSGEQTHGQALSYLTRSRILLLPSYWEGLPISVIEAMHRGIPVVASNVVGTAELILDGQTGYLVDVDDVAAYADRIRHLLGDEGLQCAMGERARARARANFAIERQLAGHFSLYETISAFRLTPSSCYESAK